MQNSIVWGNTAGQGTVGQQQVANLETSTPLVASSLIAGSGGSGGGWDATLGTDGGNNLDADPLFIDPSDAGADGTWGTDDDDTGDLRLRSGSPAIDVGDNAVIPAGVTMDGHGRPRILNSVVDMGGVEALHTNPVYIPLLQQLPPPPHTISYYMATRNRTTITGMGCEQGRAHRDEPGVQDGVVILMFGEPFYRDINGTRVYGAWDYTDNFISPDQIREEVRWFAEGYMDKDCRGNDISQLTLAIGTSNRDVDGLEFAQEPREFGRQWGQMLNDLQNDLEARRVDGVLISDYVTAHGASDMELDWGTPSDTREWVVGYILASSQDLYNYGDAAGCPPVGSCNNRWTEEDIWYISIHGGAVPQIYNEAGANGDQWYHISLDAIEDNPMRHPVDFPGSLTQHGACEQEDVLPPECIGGNNTPEEGWRQLWNSLRGHGRTRQAIPWSTDIRYSPQ